jgi:glycosyltransferase involved in cell wall biosynthesis
VGRLSREKGQMDLVRAVANLRDRTPGKHFAVILLGDGPERNRIEDALKRFKLQDWVKLAGHKNDLRPYYSIADVSVVPSHSEGSPNALLESMSAGIPIVATAVGGIPDIARNGKTALLVPRSNPDELATALGRLLDDENLRKTLGANARIAALEYDPQKACDAIRFLYERVLLR